MRSSGRTVRRLFTALALALAVVLGLAQNAYADVVAENSGVRGRGDWSWGVRELRGIHLGVRDLSCDSNPVYVQLRVYFRDETFTDILRRNHEGGCGTAQDWFNLYLNFGATIAGVRVRACVNRNLDGDSCALSGYHDNPLT